MRSLTAVLLLAAGFLRAAPPPAPSHRDKRPIKKDTSSHCHDLHDKTREARQRLDIREEALKPTENGVLPIVPGDPDKSEIILRIFDDEDPIPPETAHKPLTTEQNAMFRR